MDISVTQQRDFYIGKSKFLKIRRKHSDEKDSPRVQIEPSPWPKGDKIRWKITALIVTGYVTHICISLQL